MSLLAVNAVTHLAGAALNALTGSESTAANQRAAASLAQGGNAKALKNLPADQQVKAAASQFEAILLRQFLQNSVGGLMGGESGSGGNVYGYMLTDVLANKLSEGGGLGLANILQKQLTPRGMNAAAAEAKGTP
ncbi:MAG TPA: rod-binding protein [Candidatus Didemnitutus sp.]|nr:rod-binding protein [Candidatus Didemnitutus sp.]